MGKGAFRRCKDVLYAIDYVPAIAQWPGQDGDKER
jgi:hypothetical protein